MNLMTVMRSSKYLNFLYKMAIIQYKQKQDENLLFKITFELPKFEHKIHFIEEENAQCQQNKT